MLIELPLFSVDKTNFVSNFRFNIKKDPEEGYKFRIKTNLDPDGMDKPIDLIVRHFKFNGLKTSLHIRGKEKISNVTFDVTIKFKVSADAHLKGYINREEVDIELDETGIKKVISMFN